MKKLLTLVLVFSAVNCLAAEQRKFTVVCDKTEEVIATLRDKYQEIPILAGRSFNSARSTISVWGNPEKETFTILDSHDGMSCVIGIGDNVTILLTEPEDKGI
jgi:hypothetical protein